MRDVPFLDSACLVYLSQLGLALLRDGTKQRWTPDPA
jgi:hypothetical protein